MLLGSESLEVIVDRDGVHRQVYVLDAVGVLVVIELLVWIARLKLLALLRKWFRFHCRRLRLNGDYCSSGSSNSRVLLRQRFMYHLRLRCKNWLCRTVLFRLQRDVLLHDIVLVLYEYSDLLAVLQDLLDVSELDVGLEAAS